METKDCRDIRQAVGNELQKTNTVEISDKQWAMNYRKQRL